MRTRFCLMSAGQKKGKGVLTAHRDWPHSIQLPAGLAGLQHRPDLWRSQICPSPSGKGTAGAWDLIGTTQFVVGPVPFPAHRVPRTAHRVPTRGWPSVLLALRCCIPCKLALLAVKPRDRPGVRLDGRCDPRRAGSRPFRLPS